MAQYILNAQCKGGYPTEVEEFALAKNLHLLKDIPQRGYTGGPDELEWVLGLVTGYTRCNCEEIDYVHIARRCIISAFSQYKLDHFHHPTTAKKLV